MDKGEAAAVVDRGDVVAAGMVVVAVVTVTRCVTLITTRCAAVTLGGTSDAPPPSTCPAVRFTAPIVSPLVPLSTRVVAGAAVRRHATWRAPPLPVRDLLVVALDAVAPLVAADVVVVVVVVVIVIVGVDDGARLVNAPPRVDMAMSSRNETLSATAATAASSSSFDSSAPSCSRSSSAVSLTALLVPSSGSLSALSP